MTKRILKSDFLILFIIIAIWVLILSTIYAPYAQIPINFLYKLSWDEYQYLPYINKVHQAINEGSWLKLIYLRDHFGYNPLFWWVYGSISYPFHQWLEQDSGQFLVVLRSITVALQCACFAVSIAILNVLKAGRIAKWIMAACVVVMPMLILTYKPFSPDYLSTLLVLLSIYVFIRALKKDFSVNGLLMASLLAGAAVSSKLTNAFISIVLGFILVFFIRKSSTHRWQEALTNTPLMIFGFTFGLLLTNPTLITDYQGYLVLLDIIQGLLKDSYHNIPEHHWSERFSHWYYNPSPNPLSINSYGLRDELFGLPMLLVILSVLLGYFVLFCHKANRQFETLVKYMLLVMGLLAMVSIIAQFPRVWMWYLIAPAFIASIGLSALLEDVVLRVKSNKRMYMGALFILAIVFSTHIYSGLQNLKLKLAAEPSKEEEYRKLTKRFNECSQPFKARHPDMNPQDISAPWGFPFGWKQVAYCDFPCPSHKMEAWFIEASALTPEVNAKLGAMGFKASKCAGDVWVYEK